MILEEKTEEEFGYSFEEAGKYQKIYCQCDYCKIIITKTKIRVLSGRVNSSFDCCKACKGQKIKTTLTKSSEEENNIISGNNILDNDNIDRFNYTFISAKSNDKIYCLCSYCGKKILKIKRKIKESLKDINKICCKAAECVIKKMEEVNLLIYGYKNHSQTQLCKDKNKATNLEKYNKEFYSQTEEWREKVTKTNLAEFGSYWYFTSEEYKKNNIFGKTQKEIQEWLNSFNYNFKPNYSILKGKELDLYDENLKLAVEYNGLYWHTEDSPQPRLKDYHYNKYKECLDQGVRLIMIYEDEWLDRQEQVKNLLKSVLNVYDKKTFARKCEVREVTKKECNEFLELYHIQGKVSNIKASYGILYDNELLGCISLGFHHRNNQQLVLNRLCFKDGVQVVGGASRLFKPCIQYAKDNGFDKIISWSDNRYSQGNVYIKLGFILEKELKPDYSYINMKNTKQGKLSKQSCKKKNIDCPEGKTEKEWMNECGYSRIWDCGKLRWIYVIDPS